MRTSEGHAVRNCSSKLVSYPPPHTWPWRKGRQKERLTIKNKERFAACLSGVCQQTESAGGLPRSRHPLGLIWGDICLCPPGPELEARTKPREAGTGDQVLTFLGRLLQWLWFDFPGFPLQRLWLRGIFFLSNKIWLLALCIFHLTNQIYKQSVTCVHQSCTSCD